MSHGNLVCVTTQEIADGVEPVEVVFYEPPDHEADSGFQLLNRAFFQRFPRPSEIPLEALTTICLHCAIDTHPEAGRAMDLAREQTCVELVDGRWVKA